MIGAVLLIIMLYTNFSACSNDPIVPEVTVEMGNEDYFVKNMDFDSSAGEKTFSFHSNVEWTVSVAPTMNGETWCTVAPNSGKKGNNTIRIKVQENTGYDDRNVVLTLTAGSTLTKNITVTQKQKNAILLTTNKFEVEPQGGRINIEVKANVDYETIISEYCKDWIFLSSKSRGLSTSNITFDISESEEYDKREGEIIFKSGDIFETVHIYQTGQGILLLTQNEYPVTDKGETIVVELKSNFSFNVQMPNIDWIVDDSKSRGVSSHTLYYTILPNETYDNREAEIVFYDRNSSIKDTLKIVQKQNDTVIVEQSIFNIPAIGENINVNLSSNIDCRLTIPDKYSSWIKRNTQSRGLTSKTHSFNIASNKTNDIKKGFILVESTLESDTIFINQDALITINEAGTLKDFIDINNLESYKSISIKGEINGTDILYIRRMINLKCLDLSECKIVNGGSSYNFNYYTSDNVIGHYMFYQMASLEKVYLPKECNRIGDHAFGLCFNLNEIIMYDEILSIGNLSFSGTNLKNITLPNKLESLGNQTFKGCEFEILILPKTLMNLGSYAFNQCNNLKEIHFKSITPPNGMPIFWGDLTMNVYKEIYLYVPKGALESYSNSEFGVFTNIVEE